LSREGRWTAAVLACGEGAVLSHRSAAVLVDLAHALRAEDLERVVREAQFRRLFHEHAIRDALQRRPSTALRQLLEDRNPRQSELEDAFLRLCRRRRVPKAQAQVRDGRRRPDFVWPEARLIVEVDSWQAHGSQHAFQADRTLSNAVQLAGWTILRFAYADILDVRATSPRSSGRLSI
jgi:very-short-patch-repair endonuclease